MIHKGQIYVAFVLVYINISSVNIPVNYSSLAYKVYIVQYVKCWDGFAIFKTQLNHNHVLSSVVTDCILKKKQQ